MYTITYRDKDGNEGIAIVEAYSEVDAENKFRMNHGSDYEIISIE